MRDVIEFCLHRIKFYRSTVAKSRRRCKFGQSVQFNPCQNIPRRRGGIRRNLWITAVRWQAAIIHLSPPVNTVLAFPEAGHFSQTSGLIASVFSGDAFALIYSIDNPESFEEVKNIREMILQVKGTESQLPPIVVVGNKTDLDEEKRQVKMELAECECIDWEHGFVECSAKKNQNIINIFSCMLIQARLNGTLNVAQIASSHSSRHIGYRDHSDVARIQQRRRSSLPISELFHRLPSGHSGRASQGATFRKRNSCTPQ